MNVWYMLCLRTLLVAYERFFLLLNLPLKEMLCSYTIVEYYHLFFFFCLQPIFIFIYPCHGNFLVEFIMTHHILFMCNHIFTIKMYKFVTGIWKHQKQSSTTIFLYASNGQTSKSLSIDHQYPHCSYFNYTHLLYWDNGYQFLSYVSGISSRHISSSWATNLLELCWL